MEDQPISARHVRITRLWADVSLQMILQDYLQKATRVLMFQHSPDNGASRDHIHVFFFGLDTKPDTIRETLRKYIPARMDLCVKTKAGKKNDIDITDQGAYNYGSRDGSITPCYTKGYTLEELNQLQDAAELNRQLIEKRRSETIIYSVKEVVKVDNVYNRLYESAYQLPNRYDMSLSDWKKWIVFQYLRAGKPAPRTADGNRYAYSLYMNMKYNFDDPNLQEKLKMSDLTLEY